jgi:hypothetical protein
LSDRRPSNSLVTCFGLDTAPTGSHRGLELRKIFWTVKMANLKA